MRHISELKKNLISLNAINSAGYWYSSKCRILNVIRDALVIMRGIKYSGLYEFQGETVTEFAMKTSNTSVQESEL